MVCHIVGRVQAEITEPGLFVALNRLASVECEKIHFSVNAREMGPSIASEISAAAAEPWIQGIVSVRNVKSV